MDCKDFPLLEPWTRLALVRNGSRPDGPHLPSLLWTLIRTDLKTRYHGSLGGYLWTLLKPLTMFLVLFGVFSFVFRMDPNYNLNLVIGLFLWDFFGESTRTGLGSLEVKKYLLTKARFPAWVVVVTSGVNALVTLSLFSIVLLGYIAIFKQALGPVEVGLYLFYLLLYYLITLGISLATSVLYIYFRDLNQVWDLVLHAGFFVAPVVYPLEIIPERLHFYLYMWMPTPIIQFTRDILVRGEVPTLTAHVYLIGCVVIVLAVGIALFRWLAPQAIERL